MTDTPNDLEAGAETPAGQCSRASAVRRRSRLGSPAIGARGRGGHLAWVLSLAVIGQAGAGLPVPQPELWRMAAPESQGFSPTALEALRADLAARGTKALLVIRNDTVVCEWYAPDHGPDRKHYTASLAKALVAGLAFAVACSDGRIGPDDVAGRFIPQWQSDPLKARITMRQLGSHTSGLEDAEADGQPHEALTGWKGDFWKRLPVPNDPFSIARDRVPVLFEPGQQMRYSNPGIAMLTWCVTAALRNAPQKDIRSLLRDRVMRPIGVPDADWSIGYGQTFVVDGLPLVPSWGGGSYTARAVARVGRLLLRGGDWDGRRLLGAEAVRLITADAGTPGPCGLGWWSNQEGQWPALPRDAFFGSGAGHQILLVVPSLNLIVMRFGSQLAKVAGDPDSFHEAYRRYLFDPLMGALTNRPGFRAGAQPAPPARSPYPPSPVIARIDWAAPERILRRAPGSDNWPITWAEDDALYTAYGDGYGFEPLLREKLSLGFARITGDPTNFQAVNLRSPTGEARGDGPAGKKASGLLCVDGVLYLWARNAGNAQLAWSADHAATWTWAEWRLRPSFGCPTFLNFGRNYHGARDGFVYVYSPDSDSAYEPADRMVLARVPKDQLRDRPAYEFFQGLDAAGQPVWTRAIAERGAVFTHPGRCGRSSVSFHPWLRRYLWVQVLAPRRGNGGPRQPGGLAIFDAPEPWGPWTTVFYSDPWDVDPGESASFPTKWMSADGRSLWLVFSGQDCFALRQAHIILQPAGSRLDRPSEDQP